MPSKAKVYIKPNIVYWNRNTAFPKWGVITTSRVVEDMVILLKEKGIDDITIGEGIITRNPKDRETTAHAFETLGYNVLKERYGVQCSNIFERPFEKVDLGSGVELDFNADILHSDFIFDLPVLKTHAQTVVSLGIKNLKGTISIESRKRCHGMDPVNNLNQMIARLAEKMPPIFVLLDGIYTLERGPALDGKARRSDLLVASSDVLSADKVGATILGYAPSQVPHLVYAAENSGRPVDLSDVELAGENIEDVASHHEYSFAYNDAEDLPLSFEKMGIKGLSYQKYDLSMCSYCGEVNSLTLSSIAHTWKGKAWDNVEILTGKVRKATPGKKKTVLIGKCIYEANKDNPDINQMIAAKGCPPPPKAVFKALVKAGIAVEPYLFEHMDEFIGTFMKRYEGKPEFEESFYRITAT